MPTVKLLVENLGFLYLNTETESVCCCQRAATQKNRKIFVLAAERLCLKGLHVLDVQLQFDIVSYIQVIPQVLFKLEHTPENKPMILSYFFTSKAVSMDEGLRKQPNMVFSHAGASLWKHNLSRKVFLQPQRGGEDPQGGFICSSLLALETDVVGITVMSYFMCWDLLSGLRDRLLS